MLREALVNVAKHAAATKTEVSLDAAKLADIVILSEDIFTIDPAKIADVKVTTTIADGKVVFEAR